MTNIHVKYTISGVESKLRESNLVYRRRQWMNKLMLTLSMATLVFGLFWLTWIIFTRLLAAWRW